MNSSRHTGPPSFGNATALLEKPAPQPRTRLHVAAESGRTNVQPSPGIPWDQIREKYKLENHWSHPRDCAA